MVTKSPWHPPRRQAISGVPPPLRQWLTDPLSLTERMQRACPGRFGICLLGQRWGCPLLDEALALGLGLRQVALIREVVLQCGETPWVFARSVVPAKTVRITQHRLTRLGTQSLGAILFSSPRLSRSGVQFAELRSPHELYQLGRDASGRSFHAVWARRSVFLLQGQPLLVSEVFLPTLLDA